jgi:3-methyladenine DNA glycosylase AlkD
LISIVAKMLKILSALKEHANPRRAVQNQKYFQRTIQQDEFLGVDMPTVRKLSKSFGNLDDQVLEELLRSRIHEARAMALVNMVHQSKNKECFELYSRALLEFGGIDHWDLVDLSAPYIVGDYLLKYKDKAKVLKEWILSDNVWVRRTAIVSCMHAIQQNEFDWILKMAPECLKDDHHYVHKAYGWMLRILGTKNEQRLKEFLDVNAGKMPRIMLRYAIEKMDQKDRKYFLSK